MEGKFNSLKSYSNFGSFSSELHQIGPSVNQSNCKQFFKVLMGHFSDQIPTNVGEAILESISDVCENKKILNVFVTSGFPNMLPFNRKDLTNQLLEVLWHLFSSYPECFDEEMANKFSRIIVRKPKEALVLIAIYAENFSTLENPWLILDYLFNAQDRFSQNDCLIDYINLLGHLVNTYKGFRIGRAKFCYEFTVQMLSSENEDVINTVYNTLSIIMSYNKSLPIPYREIKAHLRFSPFQQSVVNFLSICPLDECEPLCNVKTLKILLRISQKSELCSYVVMRLASNLAFAKIMLQEPIWMKAELPTINNTLNLFLVVFKHQSLRPAVVILPEFIDFLNLIVEDCDPYVFAFIPVLFRRIELSHKFIQMLSQSSFIAKFLSASDRFESSEAQYNAILFADTIAKVSFVKEMVPLCETVYGIIEEGNENSPYAVSLAKTLCNHPKCLNAFKRLEFDKYLRNNMKNMKNKKVITEIIKLVSSNQE